MKSNGQDVIRCKNCGSNKIQVSSVGCALFGVGFMLIIFGIWIPFLGWFIMMPAGAIFMLLGMLSPLLFQNKNVTCKSCEHTFSVDKNTYKEYRKSIK